MHPGVYAVGRPATTPLERASAAVLACGPDAALSHGSAMTLWGFWKRWDAPFEVTTARDRRPKGIRVHRSRILAPRDTTRHHGIRASSPARTILDMAARLGDDQLRRTVKNALASLYLGQDALIDVVARHPGHLGASKLRPLLDDHDDTRSRFEDGFPAFCRRFGLPKPVMNARLGRYTVDAFFPNERLIVELDSWHYHSSREAFEDDRERDAYFLAADLATVRITWRRIEQRPREEAERLHAILARRRRQLHSPAP
jgi:very-short-patch-repair endonuclease